MGDMHRDDRNHDHCARNNADNYPFRLRMLRFNLLNGLHLLIRNCSQPGSAVLLHHEIAIPKAGDVAANTASVSQVKRNMSFRRQRSDALFHAADWPRLLRLHRLRDHKYGQQNSYEGSHHVHSIA